MACENDKCEKYGMHHDYVDGVEVRKCQFCREDEEKLKDLFYINLACEFTKEAKECVDFNYGVYEFAKFLELKYGSLKNPPTKEG